MKRVIVTITLKPTEEGGRRTPITVGSYNCPIFFEEIKQLSEHGWECRIFVSELGKPIKPGTTVDEIPVVFLSEEDVLPYIAPGTRFRIWEGRVIGCGTVIRIEE